jgi:hypothetical protein
MRSGVEQQLHMISSTRVSQKAGRRTNMAHAMLLFHLLACVGVFTDVELTIRSFDDLNPSFDAGLETQNKLRC